MDSSIYDSDWYWRQVAVFKRKYPDYWQSELSYLATDFADDYRPNYKKAYKAFTDYAEDFIDDIETAISENTASDIFEDTVNDISNAISGFQDDAYKLYSDSVEGLTGFITPVIETIDELIDGVQSTLSYFITWVDGIIIEAVESINSIIESASIFMENLYQSFIVSIGDVINAVEEQLTDVFNYVVGEIDKVAQEVYDSVGEAFEQLVAGMVRVYEDIDITVGEVFDEVMEDIEVIAEKAGEFITDLAGSLGKVADLLTGGVLPGIEALISAASNTFGIADSEENISIAKDIGESFSHIFKAVADGSAGADDMFATYQDSGVFRTALGGLLSVLVLGLSNSMMFFSAATIANQARAEELTQQVWQNTPIKNYSLSESAVMAARGILPLNEYYIAAEKEGYSNEKASNIYTNAQTSLDVERSIAAFRRDILSEDGFKETLTRLGMRDTDIGVVRDMVDIIPPVQDIISMAVRDVFSPEVVSKFQLFSDLPEVFVQWAGKQGLTEEWAQYYWGAHWRLPSANQGFEMFHRGVIDDDTLNLLLRALDVSPFWRDALKQIAYQPVTRVDIRRLYKLKLIDREEVIKRHRDIGYSPEDAVLMADFVQSYVDQGEDEDGINTKELSQAQVKRLWALGTITADDAKESLVTAGYSEKGADLLVESWIDEDEISFRESLITRLIRKAIRENMNDTQVINLFSDLNPTVEEMDRIKKTIEAEATDDDKTPSKAELKQMVEAGIIGASEFYDAMVQLGYSDYWIDKYQKLWEIE